MRERPHTAAARTVGRSAWSWISATFLAAGLAATARAEPAYDVGVEDTMRRVRIDAPFTGAPQKAGALPVRPHPGSLPRPAWEPAAPPAPESPAPESRAPESRAPESRAPVKRREVRISAAPGEREGFQVVISATGGPLSNVTMSASPLARAGAAGAIPAEHVAFRQVGYVKTAKPAYDVERTGWFADPLLAPPQFQIRQGDAQPVWVTIAVPPGTPAGEYRGQVVVAPQNAPATSVPVRLRVWDFEIPAQGGALDMAFTWDEAGSAAIHGADAWRNKDLKRRYLDCLLEHRLGVDHIYRGSPPSVEDVKYATERGAPNFNLFNVGWPASYTEAQIEAILARIEAVWKAYEVAGVADKAYIYGFDEHYQETAIPQIYGAIGKRFPKLRRAVSTGPRGKPADAFVDIWSMSLGTYFAAMQAGHVDRLQPRGAKFWLYLSSAAGPPRPNWWLENALIESRSLFWLIYQVDADGCLYYFINHSVARPQPIDERAGAYTTWNPHSFPGLNGDGHLIYAGLDGPLASVRMANIRDGVEDHAYLKTLERLLLEKGKAPDLPAARKFIKHHFVQYVGVNFWIHTHEPERLRAARERVAEAIEDLRRTGGANLPPPP